MLRRYAPMKRSRGTVIPSDVRRAVVARDVICIATIAGLPGEHGGTLELDHVRGSGAIGMKSPSTLDNLVLICARHHRWKTEHGREARPLLLDYLAVREDRHALCVDPCSIDCRAAIPPQ